MDRILINFLGHLQKTTKGNPFIIVARDDATTWVETKAIPGATAVEVAPFIVDKIEWEPGWPRGMFSDREQAFKSTLLGGLTKVLGIRN